MTTARFHINGEGNPGRCSAKAGGCPFGSEAEHHSSKEEARAAYEKEQEAQAVTPSLRSTKAIKRRYPEVYEALFKRTRQAHRYNLEDDAVVGDTVFTPQGRLYRVDVASDAQIQAPALSYIKVTELNPRNGVPIDGRSENLNYFQDSFSSGLLVEDYRNSGYGKEQELEKARQDLQYRFNENAYKGGVAQEEWDRLVAENPKVYDEIDLRDRLIGAGRREHIARLEVRKGIQDSQNIIRAANKKALELAQESRFLDVQETVLIEVSKRKLPSLPKQKVSTARRDQSAN